jgi:hypothetical protein
VSLSLEKVIEISEKKVLIDLQSESWGPLQNEDPPSDLSSQSLEAMWGPLLFLKALGFQKLYFRNPSKESLQNWQARVEDYQQQFIHDPEYLQIELCQWNETGNQEESSSPSIECWPKLAPKRNVSRSVAPRIVVPLMKGPMKSLTTSMRAFVEEVRSYEEKDTLRRMQAILREFKNEKKGNLNQDWGKLIGSVFRICLEEGHLSVAQELVNEYTPELVTLWDDQAQLRLHLQASDASSPNFYRWAALFNSLKLEQLVPLLETELGSGAGPQIIKLMTYRAEREHETLIELCVRLKPGSQKILLQWLAPYWKPKHYPMALKSLQKLLDSQSNLELVHAWVQAMLKSYRAQALIDLKKVFSGKSLSWKDWFKAKTRHSKGETYIIRALAENPSGEILQFLKELKPQLRGEAADEAERVLQNFRGMRME